jgi:hypothetical protein
MDVRVFTRPIAVLLLGGAGLVVGAASSLAFSSDSLGAATVTVPRCTTAGLVVTHNLSAGTVASVTVAGLPSGCGSATLQVTVNNGTTNGSGSGTVPSGGGSVTVTLGTAPAVTTALQTDLVVVGP